MSACSNVRVSPTLRDLHAEPHAAELCKHIEWLLYATGKHNVVRSRDMHEGHQLAWSGWIELHNLKTYRFSSCPWTWDWLCFASHNKDDSEWINFAQLETSSLMWTALSTSAPLPPWLHADLGEVMAVKSQCQSSCFDVLAMRQAPKTSCHCFDWNQLTQNEGFELAHTAQCTQMEFFDDPN